MTDDILIVHRPALPSRSLVLDPPHSGFRMPADFGSVLPESALRDGEDCFIDELYTPAVAGGVPLPAAPFPRTYLDVNRRAGDIARELLAEPRPRADIVLGDRDRTTCSPEFGAAPRSRYPRP